MEAFVALLKEKGLVMSTVESLTGGLLAANIASVAGASKVFKGSLVTYQTVVKTDVLGIEQALIDTYGVVSDACAEAMACCGKQLFESDMVVSCTGNAGPEAMEGKPVGMVYMAICLYDQVRVYEHVFQGDRNEIREQVCAYIIEKASAWIKDFDGMLPIK